MNIARVRFTPMLLPPKAPQHHRLAFNSPAIPSMSLLQAHTATKHVKCHAPSQDRIAPRHGFFARVLKMPQFHDTPRTGLWHSSFVTRSFHGFHAIFSYFNHARIKPRWSFL